MKITIEQRLVGSRPERSGRNEAFLTRTMHAVRESGGVETFQRVSRKTSTTKREHLLMRIKHVPKWAGLGLAGLGLLAVTGSAYAAYQIWLDPTRCAGNYQETCTTTSTVTNGSQRLTNPNVRDTITVYDSVWQRRNSGSQSSADATNRVTRTIGGRLVSHRGGTFTLRASSGALFTVTGDEDFLGEYNATGALGFEKYNYGKPTANLSVQLGDMLTMNYSQPQGLDPHIVTTDGVSFIGLVVTGDAKAGTLEKY